MVYGADECLPFPEISEQDLPDNVSVMTEAGSVASPDQRSIEWEGRIVYGAKVDSETKKKVLALLKRCEGVILTKERPLG